MAFPPSEESTEYDPLGCVLSDDRLAEFRDQSQLDFDIAFYGRVLRQAPNYVDVLRCQGELLTRKGLYEKALVIDRRLVRLLPEDPVVRYNLACSLALAGEAIEAIEHLRVALECGYEDIEYLLADSDLASLRDVPAYQALVRQFVPDDAAADD
jgi:tetratricopeptide (TPR) repeat protein